MGLAFGQFSEDAKTVPSVKPQFAVADEAWRGPLLAYLKRRFLDKNPGAQSKPCSPAASMLYFLNEDIVYTDRDTKAQATAKAVKTDFKGLEAMLADTMARTEVVFGPKWWRDKCLKAHGGGIAAAAALSPELKAALDSPERGDCRAKIGAKDKSALLIFTDGGNAPPPESIGVTGAHEAVHLVMGRYKSKDAKLHHGLTDWLQWGDSKYANSATFKVPPDGCAKYSP